MDRDSLFDSTNCDLVELQNFDDAARIEGIAYESSWNHSAFCNVERLRLLYIALNAYECMQIEKIRAFKIINVLNRPA